MEEFWIFFGGKEGFKAFCMVLWVFDGNMVGKWTNEPCNGVDEVVNPFWVITDPIIVSGHRDTEIGITTIGIRRNKSGCCHIRTNILENCSRDSWDATRGQP